MTQGLCLFHTKQLSVDPKIKIFDFIPLDNDSNVSRSSTHRVLKIFVQSKNSGI